MGKEKKKMMPFWGKTADEKQNSATILISVDRKGEVFPVKELQLIRQIHVIF